MGLLRTLLLGDIGNWLDNEDTRKEMRRSQSHRRRAQRRVDKEQDERIESLEQEVDDLQVTVAALTRVLIERGHLDEASIERILATQEEEAPPGDRTS